MRRPPPSPSEILVEQLKEENRVLKDALREMTTLAGKLGAIVTMKKTKHYDPAQKELERHHLIHVLGQCKGHLLHTARALKIKPGQLYTLMKQHGITTSSSIFREKGIIEKRQKS